MIETIAQYAHIDRNTVHMIFMQEKFSLTESSPCCQGIDIGQ